MRQPRQLVRAVTAACALFAVLGYLLVGWRAPTWWAAPLLALAAAAGERHVLALACGRRGWQLSLTDVAAGTALAVAPGGWLAAALAVGTGTAQLLGRQPQLNAAFGVGRAALAAVAAVTTARSAGGAFGVMVGTVVGVAGYVLVGYLSTGLVVSATAHRPFVTVLRAGLAGRLGQPLGNAAFGGVVGWQLRAAPQGLVVLVAVAGLVWSAYDQQRRRAAEGQLYSELVHGQEEASGRSVDVSAQVVLAAAARLLGGADVELVLRHPGGPQRYTGDEYGVRDRQPVAGDAFDAPWALRALGTRGVVVDVDDAGRPWLAATIGTGSLPLAVLVAHRPAGAPRFGRHEILVLQALAGQAATWLAVSEVTGPAAVAPGPLPPAAGRPDAVSAAALRAARESAHRLFRLTTRLDTADPLADIVAELHACAQAVAALVGAAGMPNQPHLPRAESGAGRTEEWTSTGVLTSESVR